MSDEPRVEISLPEPDESTTVEQLVALQAMADALRGEAVTWPTGASDGWGTLLAWAERIPGSWIGFTVGATSIRLANAGTITRLTRKENGK